MKTILLTAAALFFSGAGLRADSGMPKSYPLTRCPVSDEKLAELGKPIKETSEDTDVYLCCKSCVKDFNTDPKKTSSW